MFAYFSKINGKDIITYTRDMVRLYFNEDDNDSDDQYLFNNQTITYWTTNSPPEEIVVRYEDIPPLFSYS
uniref:Uncharacterized protein n=1 Tax=viral metagenome TaxID=1070528 RepID=A0A6C0LAJ3_9ZZZZ